MNALPLAETLHVLHVHYRPEDRNSKADGSSSGQGVRMLIPVYATAPYGPFAELDQYTPQPPTL